MLQTIYSDTSLDVVFLYFLEPGETPYWYGSRNILTCLDFMKLFGLGAAIGLKEITPEQATRWDFGNLFVPFGIPKIIVVDADDLFDVMFKNNYQETLLIRVHAVSRVKHKALINEGFQR